MVPATTEQKTALQILRTSSSIDTPEKLAAVIKDKDIPRYCQIDERKRKGWLGDQINALNYMTHASRITSEVDLVVEASMIDQAIMDDGSIRWLTQVEMQEAFRRGITKEYGDFFGITAASVVQFLRGFMAGEKRLAAKTLIRDEERKKQKEGEDRLWAEIERMKAEGKFTPTWGPQYNFKESK